MLSGSKLGLKNPVNQIKYKSGRKIGMELYALPPNKVVEQEDFKVSKHDIEI